MDMSMDSAGPPVQDALVLPGAQHAGAASGATGLAFYDVFADAGPQRPQQHHQPMNQHQPHGEPCSDGHPQEVEFDALRLSSHGLGSGGPMALGTSMATGAADTACGPFSNDGFYGCWPQDPMDLDYDPDLASWVSSWGVSAPHSASHPLPPQMSPPAPAPPLPPLHQHQQQKQPSQEQQHAPQQQAPGIQGQKRQQAVHPSMSQPQPHDQQYQEQKKQQQQQQQQPTHELQALLEPHSQTGHRSTTSQGFVPGYGTGSAAVGTTEAELSSKLPGPDDFLFPDDEAAAVISSQTHASRSRLPEPQRGPLPQPSAQSLDLNDPATLALYDEVFLFSRGNHQESDKLTFSVSDSAQEAILHRLALRFRLSYSYEPVQHKASIWRPSPISSFKQKPTNEPPSPMSAQPSFDNDLAVSSAAFQSMSQTLSSPCHDPFSADDKSAQKRHTVITSVAYPLLKQDANTAGLSVGLTPPPPPPPPPRLSLDSGAAASAASALVGSAQGPSTMEGFGGGGGENDDKTEETPSLGDRLSSSWSIFHSGISSRRPRGRRGPLSAKSRKDIKDLEWAGGACWRCKILRRKCDPGVPCKNCPAPDLREDAPPWPLIGCRRGNLRDAMPPQVLCTKSRALLASCSRKLPAILAAENVVDNLTGGPPPAQPDLVSQCFREAEMQCLSDNKLVLDNPALFLRAHDNSAAAQHFSQAIRNGRYRGHEALNVVCQAHARKSTYSDLISSIAWELADNSECLNVLEIESVEGFMLLLETACLYEVEVGKSPMVALSLVCLRNCLDALRLSSARLLDARLHSTCQSDRCSVDCLRELATCIDTYIEELSLLMFRKVSLRDRRWWLSTFHSLCIQAYVRRALLVIEQQLLFPDADDVDVLYSSQYLHLVTMLFIAVSFQYDPLVSNGSGLRLQQSFLAEDEIPTADTFVPDRYFAAARGACAVDIWIDEGIKSSYQFLTRLLNIGSVDFDMGQVEGGGDVSMEGSDAVLPLRRLHGLKSDSFSLYSTPNSSTTSFASSLSATRSASGVISPPSSCGPLSSSTSSPRTSLLMTERRSSVGSLPSRLSVPSFPSFSSTAPDAHSGRMPLPARPGAKAAMQGEAGSPTVPESGGSRAGSTATVTTSAAGSGNSNISSFGEGGLLICTCCPKRPQRFETPEALKLHQKKKPHICAFCFRRFSRMNEAERHITTIHLRPFSWVCGRLATPLQAFQCVRDGTEFFDVCGFCGRQFQRPPGEDGSSSGQGEAPQGPSSDHWRRLVAHVQVGHKLHDCKASGKKFYREDMFGQHLKLSHAAEPGVWLKYLENVCKQDEKESADPKGEPSKGPKDT